MVKVVHTSYSGDKFREFLRRKGIIYKIAAADLGMDKNTIGKAVRGGNLNVDVLLKICNKYNFPIEYFFEKKVVGEIEGENQENSFSEYAEPGEKAGLVAMEELEEYKTCENISQKIKYFLSLVDNDLDTLRSRVEHFRQECAVEEESAEQDEE